MTHAEEWESLEHVEATGASYDQLRRWRQLGLVPTPRRVGLGRGKGSKVFYPAGTARLVSRIQKLLQIERDLKSVGYQLWCERFPVTDFVRGLLLGVLEAWEERSVHAAARLETGVDDPEFAGKEHAPTGLGWLRLVVGEEEFPLLERLVVSAVRGEPDWTSARDPRESAIINRALEAAAARVGLGSLFRELDLKPVDVVEFLSGKVDFESLRSWLENAPASDLDEIREQARRVYWRWEEYAEEPLPHPLTVPPSLVVYGLISSKNQIPIDRFAEALDAIPETWRYFADDARRALLRGGFLKPSELTDRL